MTSKQRMPGDGLTDDDLRRDVELTREELAGTIDALTRVPARMRRSARLPVIVTGVMLLLVVTAMWWRRKHR
ncbi:hypothetical protein JOF56_009013 [Kibdelosporangium banguiense]|uniref:DUF3618 domain-containing protein n=1 Tax=Kibdelosporangium banguiense TaxID=1365924 RepID=A0ABS4TX97_9PSEU|nr:DUF3618 domain-containing protein [Kibdelosporangium banguiense]MBP2328628.1 hypothetical protein [Kibdelosporangium banguiense]